jgi:DNA-binding transcriptional MocR family regulator
MDWQTLSFDPVSSTPIYRQLSQRLAGWIHDGTLPDGTRLLPTRELAGLLGLNRTTVAAAYEALEADGLLKAHVGRGSYVCAPGHRFRSFDWAARFRASLPAVQTIAAADPDAVNFLSWRSEPAPWAIEALRRAATEVLSGPILQLGPAEGYSPLREYLWSRMAAEGHARPEDDLLITSGCQQGLDLVAKVLVAPGDTVLVEDPVYPGARDLFLAAGVQVRGLAVGPWGISTTELEQELTRSRPGLLVVTPNFQNPTGATLPLEARREVLRLAARFQVPIVENDVYAGLRYRGEDLPSLKSLDPEGLVIYLRSFSKAAFPGLRVGWCVAPQSVVRRLAAAKQLTDLHTDQLSQAVLHRLAVEGVLHRHLENLRAAGTTSLEAALDAVSPLVLARPDGGAHLWLRLPEPLDASELLVRARDHQVVFIPGRYFAVSRSHAGALRLTFAGLAPDQVRRGLAILTGLIATLAPAAQDRSEGGVPALV